MLSYDVLCTCMGLHGVAHLHSKEAH
eukprot:COSAG01_NODE_58032_length_308_cov_1.454545_2_plen_25_part_01